jgi:hypothetical protein
MSHNLICIIFSFNAKKKFTPTFSVYVCIVTTTIAGEKGGKALLMMSVVMYNKSTVVDDNF